MRGLPRPPATTPRGADDASVLAALGGRRGLAESGLPGLVFVVVYTAASLRPAVWAAVAVAVLLTGLRLLRRQTLQYALGGLVGVAVAAFLARRSGRAEDFFLPGLFLNAGYAVAYLVSIVVRYPLLGVVVGAISGEGLAWRQQPDRLRAYQQASALWVGMFVLRLVVQVPLYLAGAVVALGVVKVALGYPLLALVLWLSYLVLRRVPPARPADDGATAD